MLPSWYILIKTFVYCPELVIVSLTEYFKQNLFTVLSSWNWLLPPQFILVKTIVYCPEVVIFTQTYTSFKTFVYCPEVVELVIVNLTAYLNQNYCLMSFSNGTDYCYPHSSPKSKLLSIVLSGGNVIEYCYAV